MTKEQEEIEILKEFKDKGYAKLYIKYNGNRPEINLKIKNSIETVLSMLEEKDKIIDLMSEVIEECRQNGVLESEEIDLSEIAGTDNIKQYFENKAKEEK